MEVYGETPANYLTRRRVERAKDLLRSANLTVTEVSVLVVFLKPRVVQLALTELVGMSPSAYQRRNAALGGPPPVPGCFLMDGAAPGPRSSPPRAQAPRSLRRRAGRTLVVTTAERTPARPAASPTGHGRNREP